MHDPVLCKTCGGCIGHKFQYIWGIIHSEGYTVLYENSTDTKLGDMLDKLNVWRLCCRTNMMTSLNFCKESMGMYPRKEAEEY